MLLYTDDVVQVFPRGAVVVFISRGEDFTVDGCQGEGRVVQVEFIVAAFVAHCRRVGRGV